MLPSCTWKFEIHKEKKKFPLLVQALMVAELQVCVLRSFVEFNKDPTKLNEALTNYIMV